MAGGEGGGGGGGRGGSIGGGVSGGGGGGGGSGGGHPHGAPGDPPSPPRAGDEIIIAGQLYRTGTRVVTWLDPGGFNAYSCEPHLPAGTAPGAPHDLPEETSPHDLIPVPRYGKRKLTRPRAVAAAAAAGGAGAGVATGMAAVAAGAGGVGGRGGSDCVTALPAAPAAPATTVSTAAELEAVFDKIVVHYDGCRTSAACFRVLHHQRGLSCHFLIDADGTVYQTLDVIERAWHATTANDSSVGFELAHGGASPPASASAPASTAAAAAADNIPSSSSDSNDSNDVKRGKIQGQELVQVDFSDAQYEALARVSAALMARFPKIENTFPRRDGVDDALLDEFARAHLRLPSGLGGGDGGDGDGEKIPPPTPGAADPAAADLTASDLAASATAATAAAAADASAETTEATTEEEEEAEEEDTKKENRHLVDAYSTDPTVAVVPHKLEDGRLQTYRGVLGHYHVQTNKIDPGPAFDWARLRSGIARALAPHYAAR